MDERTTVWWELPARDGGIVPDYPPIDITDRVAAHHVEGRCERWCLDTPAGPCDDMCVMDWLRGREWPGP